MTDLKGNLLLTPVQRCILDSCTTSGALKFGCFTLKSGRKSPLFFNAGRFRDGVSMNLIAEALADIIQAETINYDIIFGAAYKGIPLATALSCALARRGTNLPTCFLYDRKEAKDHGEGGFLVGATEELRELQNPRVLVVDDVLTAGTAVKTAINTLRNANSDVQIAGILLILDREEVKDGCIRKASDIMREEGIPVFSILNMSHLCAYLGDKSASASTKEVRQELKTNLEALMEYRKSHGA